MIEIRWNHPTVGRVSEIACEYHEREILSALRTLGVGCIAERKSASNCLRCDILTSGHNIRDYLPTMVI